MEKPMIQKLIMAKININEIIMAEIKKNLNNYGKTNND
jgi:hypothetical protein